MKPEIKSRLAAVKTLSQIMQSRQPLDVALENLRAQGLPLRDQSFAQALTLLVLRRSGELDAVLAQFMEKRLDPKKLSDIQHALRLGVAQLLWLETPPHAAIATTVDLVKALKQPKLAGLANAVLRRISEKRAELAAPVHGRYNTPLWLWKSWVDAYGKETAHAIADAHRAEPPLDITVRGALAEWTSRLEGEAVGPRTIRRKTGDVAALPGYADGAWWVQDVAAALPVQLLGDVNGKRVFDLCAAPGGKSAQLAVAGAQVVAVDRSAKRMARLTANMQRLNLPVETVIADVLTWEPEEQADAILLDAPCSATGTIRRHPDILYTRTPEEVVETVDLQRKLLDRAAGWLKPGGALVYCVCSLQPEEGEAQIARFLSAHNTFRLEPIAGQPEGWVKDGMLRTLPCFLPENGGMDGFFAAKIVSA